LERRINELKFGAGIGEMKSVAKANVHGADPLWGGRGGFVISERLVELAGGKLRLVWRGGRSLDGYPGTSCLATISLSLRDKSHSPIERPRINLALME
jgi:hypothetical protein